MRHDWIVETLADLRDFASQNDLPVLAAHLNHTLAVAEAEIGLICPPPSATEGEDCALQ